MSKDTRKIFSQTGWPMVRGMWWAIQVEPIMLSNEWISVIAVVHDSDKYHTHRMISESKIKAMYGEKAKSFQNRIKIIERHLHYHFDNGWDMADFLPPITGTRVTEKVKFASNSLEDAINQVIRNVSCFGTLLKVPSNKTL